jgi:SAM-dependent methyltransferase
MKKIRSHRSSQVGSVGPSTHTASHGDWWEAARAGLLRELLAPHEGEPGVLFDVGCGSGYVVSDEGGLRARLRVGIDAWQWPHWHVSSGAHFVVADVNHLPFRSGCADVALVLDVLEHLADDAATLGEISRVLGRTGRVAVMVPAFEVLWSAHDEAVGHYRRYRIRDLTHPLSKAGLRAVRKSYFFAWLFPIALVGRLLHLGRSSDRTPAILAPIAKQLGRFERFCIRHGVVIPFGTSAFVEATRALPGQGQQPRSSDRVRRTMLRSPLRPPGIRGIARR